MSGCNSAKLIRQVILDMCIMDSVTHKDRCITFLLVEISRDFFNMPVSDETTTHQTTEPKRRPQMRSSYTAFAYSFQFLRLLKHANLEIIDFDRFVEVLTTINLIPLLLVKSKLL